MQVAMSLFDLLPRDLQEVIMKSKFDIETNCLQAFVDDFEMKVLSSRIKKVCGDRYNPIVRYKHKILLTYKPTGKCLITPYSHGVSPGDKITPKKSQVVHGISYDAYWFNEGDWTYKRNSQGGWNRTCTYRDYIEDSIVQNGEGSELMTFRRFIRWRNIVRKTELMMQDRFERFMACSEEDPS